MRHADQRHAGLSAVTCDRCAATVLVAKFSAQHTSVQWDAAALSRCPQRREAQVLSAHGTRSGS